MREFFLAVFFASVTGALAVSFAGGSVYEKYIKYVVSLLFGIVIISPFASVRDMDFTPQAQSAVSASTNDETIIKQQTEKELLAYFDALLSNEMGINVLDIGIEMDMKDGEMVIGEITVYVDPDKTDEVQLFLSDEFGPGLTAKSE